MTRHESATGKGEEMSELVEHEPGDRKETATTRVHIVRQDDDASGTNDDGQVDADCEERARAGKYYSKIHVGRKDGRLVNPRPCGGQTVAATMAGARRAGGPRHEGRTH